MVILFVLAFVMIVLAVEVVKQRLQLNKMMNTDAASKTVDGIVIPNNLLFTDTHLWVKRIDENTATIGIDDFSRRLIGKPDKVVLPLVNTDVNSGQSCFQFRKNNVNISMVSPLKGSIVAVNTDLLDAPEAIFEDPYDTGWLLQIRSWKLSEQLDRLFSANSAVDWMQGVVEKLRAGQSGELGLVAQDGGQMVEDISDQFDRNEWVALIHEHLGMESRID